MFIKWYISLFNMLQVLLVYIILTWIPSIRSLIFGIFLLIICCEKMLVVGQDTIVYLSQRKSKSTPCLKNH